MTSDPDAAASPRAATAPYAAAQARLAHRPLEDVFGLLTGAFVASLGLAMLQSVDAVTGGTAGAALLLSYAIPVPFGVLFFAVNVPFFVLAVRRKGWSFTARSAGAVALASVLTGLQPIEAGDVPTLWAVGAGNLLAGIGLLILFRHRASLGGFNVLALTLQERFGWSAGYVQMSLDVAVILAALAVVPLPMVAISAVGAVLLSFVLVLNHRPGRYLGT